MQIYFLAVVEYKRPTPSRRYSSEKNRFKN